MNFTLFEDVLWGHTESTSHWVEDVLWGQTESVYVLWTHTELTSHWQCCPSVGFYPNCLDF